MAGQEARRLPELREGAGTGPGPGQMVSVAQSRGLRPVPGMWLETNPKCLCSEDSVWLEITSGSKGLSDTFPVCLPGCQGSHFVVNSVPLTPKGFGTEVTLESVK